MRIDGKPRSSIVIDPPDGRVPALDARGAQARGGARPRPQGSSGEFDHPELRGLAERCLLSFGSNAGPPMLPNYFYNNNYQIVQTKDHVMIMTEMVHDVRVIRHRRRPAASARRARAPVDGRLDRALGRRHARRRDDELPSAAGVPRRLGEPEGHRALHAHRPRHDRLPVHGRRSRRRSSAVDRRAAVQPDGRADLRVRVPRRQLRALQRPRRRARQGRREAEEKKPQQ